MAIYIIQASLENLKNVREWLQSTLDTFDIDKRASFQVVTAVNEVVTNVIVHTHRENPTKKVGIKVDPCGDGVRVEILDFCPECEVKIVEQEGSVESESGFGLRIVRSLVDHFEHRKVESGNLFILVKYACSRVRS